MSSIIWIKEIQPNEYPPGVIEWMVPSLFNNALFPLRMALNAPIWPSMDLEAHVRHDSSTSQHSTRKKTKKSKATDSFVLNEHVSRLIRVSQRIEAIGGFGLYFDTRRRRERTLFHIDTRPGPQRILWIRVDGEYIYQHLTPERYYKELAKQLRIIKHD